MTLPVSVVSDMWKSFYLIVDPPFGSLCVMLIIDRHRTSVFKDMLIIPLYCMENCTLFGVGILSALGEECSNKNVKLKGW
jgi:hypothetical protein